MFGVLYGAVQGYFAGWTDIGMERFIEIWGAMPTLYMLIIFASMFSPSFWLLLILLSLFGWMGYRELCARGVPEEPARWTTCAPRGRSGRATAGSCGAISCPTA